MLNSVNCDFHLQSFFAGMGFSGALTSGLRLVTKAIFDKARNGLRKGACKLISINDCYLTFSLMYPRYERSDFKIDHF